MDEQPLFEEASKEELVSTEEEKKENELKEYKDKYLRALAEMENMRKRMQKERQDMTRFAVENLLTDFIKPIDSMETALKFCGQLSDETRNWAKGFEMILSQFKEVLSEHGVSTFDSVGQLFDPHDHEAIEMKETTEAKDGTILKEFAKGYKCKDRVLRPAKVTVAKAPSPAQKEEEDIKNTKNEEN